MNNESRPWHIVLPSPTSSGNSKSATETALSLALGPAFIFLLGVAGGFPNKTNMYDVVVAERVYDVDAAKIDPEGNYIPRPDQHKATSVLLSRAKTLQDMGGWQNLLHPNIPNEPIEVWIEPIAAGSKLVASSSSEEFNRILRDAPRAIAVENEGFGVMQAAHEAAIAALVIRGISDLIDNRPRDSTEVDGRIGPDPHKLKAARHAAAFMFALISRLNSEAVDEVTKAEEEWVDVRLRWDDLKELAKGKRLALQIMKGSPIRDITGKTGSVEIEFKTKRLVSAFVYAISLERDLIKEMIGMTPDRVDTKIDTSDPDVARIFSAVRKLASKIEIERRQGENDIQSIANSHASLKVLSEKVISASRKATRNNKAQSKIGNPAFRLSISISRPLRNHLKDLANERNSSVSRVATELAAAALDQIETNSSALEGFLQSHQPDKIARIMISPDNPKKIDTLSRRYAIPPSKIVAALILYAVEMRPARFFGAETQQRSDQVTFNLKVLGRIIDRAEKNMTELARRAGVDTSTIRRAIQGQPIRLHTANKILDALSPWLGDTNKYDLLKYS